jgi:hypothetical protein
MLKKDEKKGHGGEVEKAERVAKKTQALRDRLLETNMQRKLAKSRREDDARSVQLLQQIAVGARRRACTRRFLITCGVCLFCAVCIAMACAITWEAAPLREWWHETGLVAWVRVADGIQNTPVIYLDDNDRHKHSGEVYVVSVNATN